MKIFSYISNEVFVIDIWDKLEWKGISYFIKDTNQHNLSYSTNHGINFFSERNQLLLAICKCLTQTGNIKAIECIIGGKFTGDVVADSLAFESNANIKGNMYYNSLSARPGSNLEIHLFRGLEKRIEDKSPTKEKTKKAQTKKIN